MEENTKISNKSTVLAPDGTRTTVLEWLPLVAAFRDTVEWVLDIAADIASEYPEEVAAVERVRRFLRHRMDGFPAVLKLRDAMFTVGLILAAIERDVGPLKGRSLTFKNPWDKLWHGLELAAARARAKAADIDNADRAAA